MTVKTCWRVLVDGCHFTNSCTKIPPTSLSHVRSRLLAVRRGHPIESIELLLVEKILQHLTVSTLCLGNFEAVNGSSINSISDRPNTGGPNAGDHSVVLGCFRYMDQLLH